MMAVRTPDMEGEQMRQVVVASALAVLRPRAFAELLARVAVD